MGEEIKDKVMHIMSYKNMRELKNKANELGIKQEEIVNIFPIERQVYLIYYR